MKIRFDRSKCQAHGQCHGINPELFPLDDDGYPTLTESVVESGDEQDARSAVAACPEDALTLRAD
ncbi:ferredoxin [[Mycobacterium] burgundiense]|uniref:Ferredoxin n=1 Tax=[Mycobacterium] burgundiense TaxID=3064286 RepID=A0ABM9M780_9MYCO|nr:ferredoxin [Mycolicibacterium sp. MU0053]CAJ1511081.1 ferredoxin [Mycolicibacterium sp. MU0053]